MNRLELPDRMCTQALALNRTAGWGLSELLIYIIESNVHSMSISTY